MFIRFLVDGEAIDVNLAQVAWVQWARDPAAIGTKPLKVVFHLAGGKKVKVALAKADTDRLEAALRGESPVSRSPGNAAP